MRAFMASALLFAVAGNVRAEERLTLDQALPIIEAFEGRIRSAQWEIVWKEGKLADISRPDSIQMVEDPGNVRRYLAWYHPPSGRYRVEFHNVRGKGDKRSPHWASIYRASYDGQLRRHLAQTQQGAKLPEGDKGELSGQIFPQDRDGASQDYSTGGIGYFPPNLFQIRFSEFLRERAQKKLPVTITVVVGGNWRIETLRDDHEQTGEETRIDYNPSRGIVTQVDQVGKMDLKYVSRRGMLTRRQTFTWERRPGDIWIPRSVFQVNNLDSTGFLMEFKDVRINEPLDESLFRVRFPVGTSVTDNVTKMSYIVSDGPVDEQSAIKKFMHQEELGRQRQEKLMGKPWHRTTATKVAAGSIAALALAGMGLWYFRRRSRSIAAIMLVAVCVSSVSAIERDQDGNWIVSPAPGERIRLTQCGLNVTIFALEYCEIHYDVKVVAAGLPPSVDGIRFADIRTMLEAHGLQVTAREKVTLADIGRVIRSGSIAVFPIKATETQNHYLAAVWDERRGAILVDPPRRVQALDSISEATVAALGGVVLFVKRPSPDSSPQADAVTLSPDRFDFGMIRDDVPANFEKHDHRLTLKNNSAAAVLVSKVDVPCGCMRVDWTGGCVPAGGSQDVVITVVPILWGKQGRVDQTLTFRFPDGSEKRCEFTGTLVRTTRIEPIKVYPEVVRIEAGAADDLATGETWIRLNDFKPDDIQVKADAAWLKLGLQPESAGRMRLQMTADAMMAGALPATAKVMVCAGEGGAPAEVTVLFSRSPRFRVEPAICFVTPDADKPELVHLFPSKPGDVPPAGVRVLSGPKGLRAERRDLPKGGIELSFRCGTATPRGTSTVECQLGTTDGDRVRVIINVRDKSAN